MLPSEKSEHRIKRLGVIIILIFALIFLIFVSLHCAPADAVAAGWLMGLMKDVYSVGPVGLNALILSICGGYVSHTKNYIYKEHPVAQLFLAVTAAWLANALYLAAMLLSPESAFGSPRLVALRTLYSILYTALPAPFLLMLLRALKPWLGFSGRITLEPKEEH